MKIKKRRKWLSFLTDRDGMGQRDFLLLVSIGSYYGATLLAQGVSLFGVEVSDTYTSLIKSQEPLAMVVVAGVMGAQAVESIGGKMAENKKEKERPPVDYPTYEQPAPSETSQDPYDYEEERYS